MRRRGQRGYHKGKTRDKRKVEHCGVCVCEVGEGQVKATEVCSLFSWRRVTAGAKRWDGRNKSRFGGRCWVWAKSNVKSLRHGQVERSG